MIKKLFFSALMFVFSMSTSIVSAQTGLNFDGINDVVKVYSWPVSGNAARTVETWIKTTANSGTGGHPHIIADWGVNSGNGRRFTFAIQNNKLRIEVQGSGVNGNTVINDGEWHHVAVVYDPTLTIKVALYVDGNLDASGNFNMDLITTNVYQLKIGERMYSDGDHFEGSIDEFRLWNVARTASEIAAYKAADFCTPPAGLVCCYKFNQGVVGGNNADFPTVEDSSVLANNTAYLVNFALDGLTSNYVSGVAVEDGVVPFEVVNENNILSVTSIGANASYQWYTCNTATNLPSVAITGAINADFTPIESGSYAVEVSKNGCITMSECMVVSSLSVENVDSNTFKMFPNPASNQVTIQLGDFYTTAEVTLTNVAGQQIMKKAVANTNEVILDLNQSAGVYFVSVVTSTGASKVMKLIKQ